MHHKSSGPFVIFILRGQSPGAAASTVSHQPPGPSTCPQHHPQIPSSSLGLQVLLHASHALRMRGAACSWPCSVSSLWRCTQGIRRCNFLTKMHSLSSAKPLVSFIPILSPALKENFYFDCCQENAPGYHTEKSALTEAPQGALLLNSSRKGSLTQGCDPMVSPGNVAHAVSYQDSSLQWPRQIQRRKMHERQEYLLRPGHEWHFKDDP